MLGEDVVAFLRSRPISMLCTRDGDNRPAAHECLLAEVTADWVIGLVPEHLARHLPENVASNGDAALLVSRSPGDHRSVQVKGRITALEPPRVYAEEIAPALELLLPMFAAYVPEAQARARVEPMRSQLFFRVKLDVAHVFDQTPGPGAGRPNRRGRPMIPAEAKASMQGAFQSVLATCNPDGTPNLISVSQVWYVDDRHVAVSFQFFNKTVRNVLANPYAAIRLFDPNGTDHWALDAKFVRSETEGKVFDAMEMQLEVIASMTGMEGVFKLKGAHIYEVLRIERLPLVKQ